MGSFPAIDREGPPLRGPSSYPSQDGQTPSWNTDGTFSGWVISGGAASPLTLTASAADQVPLKINAHASQTANLFEVRNGAGTLVNRMSPTGGVHFIDSDTSGSGTFPRFLFDADGQGVPELFTFRVRGTDVLSYNLASGWQFAGNQARAMFSKPLKLEMGVGQTGGAFEVILNGSNAFKVRAESGTNRQINIGQLINSVSPTPHVSIKPYNSGFPVLSLHSVGSVDSLQFRNSSDAVVSRVNYMGAMHPPSLTDSAALNGSVYYSTTASKLVYKDGSGVVNALY